MQENIPAPAATTNLVAVVPTIDTIELFVRWPRQGMKKEIERTVGRRIKLVRHRMGATAKINRPPMGKLAALEALRRQYRAAIHRYDVAFDFVFATPRDAYRGGEYIDRHAVLKWRAKNVEMELQSGDYGDGMLWVYQPGKRRTSRWLVRYRKNENVQRLELKFNNAGIVRRTGVTDLRDLAQVNPATLFSRHIKFARWTEKYRQRLIQRVVKDKAKKKDRAANRRFPYDLPRRISSMLDRQYMQMGGNRRHMETISAHVIGIPARLSSETRDRQKGPRVSN